MPTVFRYEEYRFYFFSREETRRHIHVSSSKGEAKIWIEPEVSVAKVINFSQQEVNKIISLVNENLETINEHWNNHFNQD